MSGNHCSHCPGGTDVTAIAGALLALMLAFLAVVFVMAHLVLIAVLLAVFALGAFAVVFAAWKYGPQLAGFRYLRTRPAPAVRARVVRAAVLPSLPAPAPAAIAPAAPQLHLHFHGQTQPEAVLRAIAENQQGSSE